VHRIRLSRVQVRYRPDVEARAAFFRPPRMDHQCVFGVWSRSLEEYRYADSIFLVLFLYLPSKRNYPIQAVDTFTRTGHRRTSGPANQNADLLYYIVAYCASKAAVTNITRQIALDYGSYKIHSNCICPGCESLPISLAFLHVSFIYPAQYPYPPLRLTRPSTSSLTPILQPALPTSPY
jgi:NAD(P)-dependent dehydrogenase (short-subunit alcohol dehydrogenase family)